MIRPASHRNLWLLTWFLVAGLMVVGVRLFDVQVMRPQEPTPFSANDPDVKRIRPARRGDPGCQRDGPRAVPDHG